MNANLRSEEEPRMDSNFNVHPPDLREKPPEFISLVVQSFVSFMERNGWYILIAGLFLSYLWSKLNPIVTKFLEDRAEKRFQEQLHKDPDLVRIRQEAQEAARLRMQLQHNINATMEAEKRKIAEDNKRHEWLSRQGQNVARAGYRLCDTSTDIPSSRSNKSSKFDFRPDYNPLQGNGGSGGYRPPRRSCPGGGCG